MQNQSNTNKGQVQDNDDASLLHLTGNTTLQTPEEHEHDKSVDPRRDTTRSVSPDDLHQTNPDRMAGSDRAGTAERKP